MGTLKRYTIEIHWKDPARGPLRVEHVLDFYMAQGWLKVDIAHEHSRLWFAHEIDFVDQHREQAVLAS